MRIVVCLNIATGIMSRELHAGKENIMGNSKLLTRAKNAFIPFILIICFSSSLFANDQISVNECSKLSQEMSLLRRDLANTVRTLSLIQKKVESSLIVQKKSSEIDQLNAEIFTKNVELQDHKKTEQEYKADLFNAKTDSEKQSIENQIKIIENTISNEENQLEFARDRISQMSAEIDYEKSKLNVYNKELKSVGYLDND